MLYLCAFFKGCCENNKHIFILLQTSRRLCARKYFFNQQESEDNLKLFGNIFPFLKVEKRTVYSRICIPQGKWGKRSGRQVNGSPQINHPLKQKIHYFAIHYNFLQCAVTYCSSPKNLAIIF